jgi:hypothetical protein
MFASFMPALRKDSYVRAYEMRYYLSNLGTHGDFEIINDCFKSLE